MTSSNSHWTANLKEPGKFGTIWVAVYLNGPFKGEDPIDVPLTAIYDTETKKVKPHFHTILYEIVTDELRALYPHT